MRRNRYLYIVAQCLAVYGALLGPCQGANFGKAIAIGGQAGDIVLDESRGLLYISNFTANRIEKLSLADNAVRSSMNLDHGQPSAMAISSDSRYLVVAHYEPVDDTTITGYLTVVDLESGTRQGTAVDKPLGLAFTADGRVLVVTTTGFDLLDPSTMALTYVNTFSNLSVTLPTTAASVPSEIVATQLAASKDGLQIYGIATSSAGNLLYRYDTELQSIVLAKSFTATPSILPRISVSDDGSYCFAGYIRFDKLGNLTAQFPDPVLTTTIGGHALDSAAGKLYAHIPDYASSTATVTTSAFGASGAVTTSGLSVLTVMDAENLTVQERLTLAENITGRAILNANRDTMYAISDSGVIVLPVGLLSQYHRVNAGQEDVVVRSTFCNRSVVTVSLAITDPGGGATDFTIASSNTGVTVSPQSGVTPATVQVRVDPSSFANTNGVVVATLALTSTTAVNIPSSVRVLINVRNPDQRGTPVNVPGTLTDIVADPSRDRFYIVRQDMNQVLVFDGSSYEKIKTLRTLTTPNRLAITWDRKYLLVGHENSQQAVVFDLDDLDTSQLPVNFPFGQYPRSIAASGKKLLAVARTAATTSLTGGSSAYIGPVIAIGGTGGIVDSVDFLSKRASALSSLGIYSNKEQIQSGTVLAAAPNGNLVLAVMPDSTVFLYNASADTFTASRKDSSAATGPYAASSYEQFVVGNSILNSSLVPVSTLESSTGTASGFAFVDTAGFRVTSPAVTSPGVIQRVDPATAVSKSTRMAESPLTPTAAWPFTRTVAPLASQSAIMVLTTSGFTVLSWTYDAAVAPPTISSIVNSADQTAGVAPGGLISIYGSQLSPVSLTSKEIPLPTALGDSCLTVNGISVPMIFVSSAQINGQLPTTVSGSATLVLRTPGGTSDNYYFTILTTAPRIFRSGTAGPETGLATITRAVNDELVTLSNPIHPKDIITIYATGLGVTSPAVESGYPGPTDTLASAVSTPVVTLGGTALSVTYAGLVPGEVGVYQINATVPSSVPLGMEVPLAITQGSSSTSLNVRVVK
jgi:uncharacterized protein (TIGR03437 family)